MSKPEIPSTRSRRAWSASLLLLALAALVLGVFGALYFQRSTGPLVANNSPTQRQAQPPAAATLQPQAPQAAAPSESSPSPPATSESNSSPTAPSATQTAQTPPTTAAPQTPARSEILPQTQSNNPPPSPESEAERLAQISPSAAPANVAAATPRYWVEFGAYEGPRYADALKQSLAQLGIEATVSNTSGKHGRRYLRVRTSDDSDHATAAAQLAKARSTLHIAPLLHRAAAVSPTPTRVPEAKAGPAPSRTASTGAAYWVQFGAFHEHQNAEHVLSQLNKSDIHASVIERKDDGLNSLYVIRVSSLSDHGQAERIAQRGATALHSHDVLIGATHATAPGLHPRPPPG